MLPGYPGIIGKGKELKNERREPAAVSSLTQNNNFW
jgi:hypothetical protein